jgi:hypothetical protein
MAYSGTNWYRERLAAQEVRTGVPGTRQRQETVRAGLNEQRGRRGTMEYACTFPRGMTPAVSRPRSLPPARRPYGWAACASAHGRSAWLSHLPMSAPTRRCATGHARCSGGVTRGCWLALATDLRS